MTEFDGGFVPLTMGDKLIGKIKFDLNTGEISGQVTDPVLPPMLTEMFSDGILEVSFYGKAALPYDKARHMMDDHLKVNGNEHRIEDAAYR